MNFPGPAGSVFLFILLVLLPLAAIRSAKHFRPTARGARDGGAPPLPPLESLWKRTLVTQAILLLLAWYVGRGFGYRIFAPGAPDLRTLGAAAVALGLAFGLQEAVRRSRDESERRDLAVMRLAPRTRREWLLWGATIAVASIAEEAAYRGVGMACLTWALGDPRPAALLMAAAFAGAHAIQGFKSGVVIFALALVLHGLVAVTGTLLPAMAVHAIFDVVAGWRIARDAARFRESAPA